MTECISFLDAWNTDPNNVKPIFERFKQVLEQCEGTVPAFKSRPGVSYSLRGSFPGHVRDLFVMVDVVDDDPNERWLSVCFYNDQITDPAEMGDWVPEGLNGKDACCFDLSDDDRDAAEYVETRIREAWESAMSRQAD